MGHRTCGLGREIRYNVRWNTQLNEGTHDRTNARDAPKPPLAVARSHWRALGCILRWSVSAKPCEENLRSFTPQIVCCWEHQYGNVLHNQRERVVMLFILSRMQILGQRQNISRGRICLLQRSQHNPLHTSKKSSCAGTCFVNEHERHQEATPVSATPSEENLRSSTSWERYGSISTVKKPQGPQPTFT